MRYLLTIAFLLMATSSFAVLTKTYTVCESGGGCDYTTVAAAESAHEQDLVANDSALTFEIQNTWVSAEGAWTVNGWTTDATRFLTITAVGAARASATFSTTAYRASTVTFAVIQLVESYTVLDGVQAETTETGATSATCFQVSVSPADGVVVKNCFGKQDPAGSNNRGAFFNTFAGTGNIFRNNVITGSSLRGVRVISTVDGSIKLDNNTFENCGEGINTSDLDAIARNNIFFNVTTPGVGNFNTTTLSEENWTDNASISYGSCGSCGTGDQLSQSDPFVNLGGGNYSLASGSTPIDAGKDLSADFTDAIGGKTRDANFDKGADEFISAGGQKVMIKR